MTTSSAVVPSSSSRSRSRRPQNKHAQSSPPPWYRTVRVYQGATFMLTFLSYVCYHATRTPYSVVKSTMIGTETTGPNGEKTPIGGWAPFNGDGGQALTGDMDTVFLSAYAIGMFFSGALGDRVNLRYFVGFGMILSGAFCAMSGIAYFADIHSIYYFAFCCTLAGLAQSTGWPANVALMARWFGHGGRGIIMGIWNGNSSVGNVIGKLISSAAVSTWGWHGAFFVMGVVCAGYGVLLMLLIEPDPTNVFSIDELEANGIFVHSATSSDSADADADVDADGNAAYADPDTHLDSALDYDHERAPSIVSLTVSSSELNRPPRAPSSSSSPSSDASDRVSLMDDSALAARASSSSSSAHGEPFRPLSFIQALSIPGVIEFGMALFFTKCIVYALGFWLPLFLNRQGYSDPEADNISSLYDVGGVVGGIVAGILSDVSGMSGVTSAAMSIASIPCLLAYLKFGAQGRAANIMWLFIAGIATNGPYCLISSAVSADLGSHPSLHGNPLALSTVTGIIDGFGSVGAALEGITVGYLSSAAGTDAVFYMFVAMCAAGALMLFRVVKHELEGSNQFSGGVANANGSGGAGAGHQHGGPAVSVNGGGVDKYKRFSPSANESADRRALVSATNDLDDESEFRESAFHSKRRSIARDVM